MVVPPDPQCSGRSIAHDESPGAQPLRSSLGGHEAATGVLNEGDIDQLRSGARAVITTGLTVRRPDEMTQRSGAPRSPAGSRERARSPGRRGWRGMGGVGGGERRSPRPRAPATAARCRRGRPAPEPEQAARPTPGPVLAAGHRAAAGPGRSARGCQAARRRVRVHPKGHCVAWQWWPAGPRARTVAGRAGLARQHQAAAIEDRAGKGDLGDSGRRCFGLAMLSTHECASSSVCRQLGACVSPV